VSSGIAKVQTVITIVPNTHVFTHEVMERLHSSTQEVMQSVHTSVQGLQQSMSTLSLETLTFVGAVQQSAQLLQSFKQPADESQQLQQSLHPSMTS
jgi:hypothetical protein